MNVNTERRGDTLIVRPVGRLSDTANQQVLRHHVLAMANDARHVVVDLSDVTGVDSSGIGELASAHAAAANRQLPLVLAGVPPAVVRVLEITNLRSIFAVYASTEEAIAAGLVAGRR